MSTRPEVFLPEAMLDFRLLVEAASDIVAVTEADTTIRFVSGAVERVLGYPPRSLVGRSVKELMTREAVAALDERLSPVAAGRPPGNEPRTYEFVARDGSARYLEVLATDLRSNPRIGGLCVVARDVTERVLSQQELATRQEGQRLAARLAGVGLWEWDLESNTMAADDSVRAILRQHEGQHWQGPEEFLQRFIPEDRAILAAVIETAVRGSAPAECTVRLALPGGGHRWLYLHGQQMASAQGKPRVLGLVMDVSAQKRAELELAQRRETLELASSAAGLCAWTWRPLEDVIRPDARYVAMVGLPAGTREMRFEQWQALLHPDDVASLLVAGEDLLQGRVDTFDSTYRIRRPEGGWRWLLDRGQVAERDAAGRAIRICGITLDIDARKRTEGELAEQRLRLRLALDAARLGLWDWDVATRQLLVDERYCEIVGTTADLVRDRPLLLHERLHPEDGARLTELARSLLAGSGSTLDFEGRLLRPEGDVRTIAVIGAVSGRDAAGRPDRVTGTIADVTERERARQMSGISEEIARVGSYEADLVTGRVTWSAGTYRIFGMPSNYRPDRDSMLQLIAPANLDRALGLFRAARESGEPFDTEIECRDTAGAPAWIRLTGRVETFGGRPVRLYGIVQDVSTRKQLERELLEVANREQQRLGSELHDGLGQELAGVSMMLEAMAQQAGSARPALRAQFARLRELVTHSVQSTRDLAHGLVPVSLQRGGLEGALRMLARQVEKAGTTRVELGFEVESPLALDEVAGNHLYRIAQEAVGNAIRHGQARHIVIRFFSRPGEAELEITDDGTGITPAALADAGFGLRSMRYRAQAVEGSLAIGPAPDRGTRIHLRCPQPAMREPPRP